ncbi:iron-siderophore ABC transporter substrate-binding protein [Roseibium sp.]|uniref:iron-siderophore ABC transporter substrate-binding protein n=1 Tax=Roseibium sp. TaxID=1936156 RepID=UPI003B5132BD
MSIDRRSFLGGAAALGVSSLPSLSASASRVVSLDYAAAETLISLGLPPVGVQSSDHWNRWVVEPALPVSVANVGQDLAVNLEVIAALKPDLIITTPYTDMLRNRLAPIAPVHMISVYDQTGTPLKNAYAETVNLGRLTGMPDQAEIFLTTADADFSLLRNRLAQRKRPPVALVNFMDDRHVRVYGQSSLYQDVLDRIGLENAWTRPTNYWGFATVGLEELARHAPENMHLIAFEPIGDEIKPTLASSPIWRTMPVVQNENYEVFPAVLTFGMVPSALRFGNLIANYMEGFEA